MKQDNARFLFHPMAHPQAMQKNKPDIIARGEGCWVWDIDGHKMIDGVAGLWSSNLGHSNQRVRDAIVAQLDELPFYNTFRGTTHPRAIELSARVVKTMAPDGVGAVMFGNSGSDAVEGALKIARQYWKVLGQPERTKFISLKQGYHGVHFGGMSVNGLANIRRAYEPLMPGCFHVDAPWLYHNAYTQDPEELGRICAGLLEREILFQGADTVAAFVAEPVQGSAGVIVPPANYWPLVREICERHKVLLIADEVVTGFGRSGAMFGTRLWGVTADIWCLAKGISSGYVPLGATALSQKVADAFLADTAGLGTVAHGYTYSGHPVAAAAALATLDELERLDVVGNVARVGAHFQARMAEFERKFSFVGDVRGVGLMTGIEMVSDKAARTPVPRGSDIPQRVAREAYQRGAMVRISGPNMILSPPLVITREEVDHLVDILEASFAAVDASL
ncbi:aminotransferase class III-fold pyridoxal phosphate-dependent enzyme [Aquabacterium sp.]|uniref:aminotransferase class III-fold pyridoxal phosphate-dependent enzyme n=1 Tax=Aquabacterium sp. TaxID=1872578 RepID=UPI002C051FB1|nr:aminotransferase class III-fold pyridoxal phosphate-dependent enzyme [Aquabacterium sp.]HSW07317.1 aminotransferase class III-fold pyridoxal phosphate-dependent enzyme [Aquabacterium sp.]